MFAIVMAGGFATRLWPITQFTPKSLLPLGRDLIIDRIMKKLESLRHINKIYVTTNAFFEYQFKSWIRKSKWDVELIIEPSRKEEEKLGTIKAMFEALKYIGKGDFLIIGSDNVLSLNFYNFIRFFEKRRSPVIAVFEIDRLEKVSLYGEVEMDDDNRIISLREKPKNPRSKFVSTACYIFPRDVTPLLEDYINSGNNLDSPGYFIEWLHKRVDVYAFPFNGFWFDIGSPRNYIEAFKDINNDVIVDSSKVSLGDHLQGSIYIGKEVTLMNTHIINSLIWHNSIIENSIVRNSIVLSNVKIRNTKIEWSIIGNNAEVEGIVLKNSVIGDYSKLFK